MPLVSDRTNATVAAECPDGWSTSTSGKCFRLLPEPYNLRGPSLPAFSECPALCGPNASLACLDSNEDVAFVAETLLCRGSPEEWRIPWATDTTLPAPPGVCVAAFLGAFSRQLINTRVREWPPRNIFDPAKRPWQCGAGSYNVSSIWGAAGRSYVSSYTSRTAHQSTMLWDAYSYYSMIGPHRPSVMWRPTSQHRDRWYGHRGNVSMVFRAAPMNEASLDWRASDTQRWNTDTPHAACLCEHTRHARGQADVADQTELHALLEDAQCSQAMGRVHCLIPSLRMLTLTLLVLPIVLVICWWICCVYPWRSRRLPRTITDGHRSTTITSQTAETGMEMTTSGASIGPESVAFVSPLVAATRAQVMLRVRVSGMLSLVGWMLVASALIPAFMKAGNMWLLGQTAIGDPAYFLTLLPWGATLLMLAVRPVDGNTIIAVRIVLVVCCTPASVSYFSSTAGYIGFWSYGRVMSHCANAVLLVVVVLLVSPLPVTVSRPVRSCRLIFERNRLASATPRAQFGRVWIAFRLIQLGSLNAALLECDLNEYSQRVGYVIAHLRCLLSGQWYAWSWGGVVHSPQAGAWYWQPTAECYFHVVGKSPNATFFATLLYTTHYPAEWELYDASRTWRQELPSVLFALSSLLCFLSSYRGNRERVLRILHRLLSPGDAGSRAASIATLLGSVNPDAAFRRAQMKLRALPLSSLHASIFVDNLPPRAHARRGTRAGGHHAQHNRLSGWSLSRQCAMGAVDAFISHAWLDDAAAKVERLKGWLPSPSADPLIWIDVACLDQSVISTSLSCLPFFILGSKQFVGLVGPRYHTRLWCIMELFFFYELRSAGPNACVFLDLRDEEHTQDGLGGAFDVHKAQCGAEGDRDFLLAIIESSFGSVQPFNNIVRTLMKRVEPMRADPSIAAASAASPLDGDGSGRPLSHGTPTMTHNNCRGRGIHQLLGAGTQGDGGTNTQ